MLDVNLLFLLLTTVVSSSDSPAVRAVNIPAESFTLSHSLRVAENLPGVGENLPGIGENLPGVGENLPGVGENLPGVGENLPGGAEMPWYDAQTDGPKRIDLLPSDPFDDRGNRWKPSNVNWSLPWRQIIEGIAWFGLTIFVLLIIYLIVKLILGWESFWGASSSSGPRSNDANLGDLVRVDSLPFQLKKPTGDLLDEARALFEAGDFNQAMIYLYSYLLIALDRHQVIRLARGKTNRQYLREVRASRRLQEMLRISMFAFEDVFFGEQNLGRERFMSCWNTLEDFHQLLKGTAT